MVKQLNKLTSSTALQLSDAGTSIWHTRPWETCQPTGRMLRPADVFERSGLSKSQVYALIAEGAFPPFIKLSARASAMPEAWLDCFIAHKARSALQQRS
jgi:predicted DNA-binding transcriptional regulator AlpA